MFTLITHEAKSLPIPALVLELQKDTCKGILLATQRPPRPHWSQLQQNQAASPHPSLASPRHLPRGGVLPFVVAVRRGQEAAVALQGPRCGAAEEGGVAGAARRRGLPRLGAAAPARHRHPCAEGNAVRSSEELRAGGSQTGVERETGANRREERARGATCSPISGRQRNESQ